MGTSSFKLLATSAGVALLVAACGGGSGGSQSNTSADIPTSTPIGASQPTPTGASQLVGTAATGAALANAPVTITNSAGGSPCEEATITTSALGSYTCTLKAGETAPFFVVVTDPGGIMPPVVSVATTTPAAGTPLTVNATPLTTAIVAQLAADGDALTVVDSGTINAADLEAVKGNVVTQLQPVLSSVGAPDGYNPFTTSISAATADNASNAADKVLDVVKVDTDLNTLKPVLSTIDNPTPVPLATSSSAGSALPAPDTGVATLSQGLQLMAQKFNACFALAKSSRVLSKDDTVLESQGGPEVTSVGAACQDFAADSGNAAGIDFLQNGYNAGQFFHDLLTSIKMTGAQFGVPEVVAFYPKASGAVAPAPDAYDRATLNIRYLDGAGNPGNLTTMASLIPGSSSASRPSEWWLVGNRQPVDVIVRTFIRRQVQMNPSNTGKSSTFMTGIYFAVNAKGPGSVNGGNNLATARISGPGLPGNGAAGTGLVYKVSSQASQSTMDLFNKTGSLTTGSLCGNNGATFNCPNFWLARTQGVAKGAGATTLAANPNIYPTDVLIWAQPTDNGVDQTKFVKGARYKVELFYGASPTPQRIVYKTLVSDLVPATSAVYLPWNKPGPQILAALDPAGTLAGAQTALSVDWLQNRSAQQIGYVSAVVNAVTGSYGPPKPLPKGVTSAVLDNVTVPAFTTGTTRTIQTGYRTMDASAKTATYTYN
jgi:hypothetical protein